MINFAIPRSCLSQSTTLRFVRIAINVAFFREVGYESDTSDTNVVPLSTEWCTPGGYQERAVYGKPLGETSHVPRGTSVP